MHLTQKAVLEIAHAPVAADTADVTDCKVIDMQNFDAVRFIVAFGTINSGSEVAIKAMQADAKTSDTALDSGADLVDATVAVADTNSDKLVVLDINRPQKRYVQLVITIATDDAVVDYAIAEKYNARLLPVTQSADVAAVEVLASPAEVVVP